MASQTAGRLRRPRAPAAPERHASSRLLNRRDLLGAFGAYAFLGEVSLGAAARRTRSVRAWLDRQEELARDLASGAVDAETWRRAVEALGSEANIDQLIADALPSVGAGRCRHKWVMAPMEGGNS